MKKFSLKKLSISISLLAMLITINCSQNQSVEKRRENRELIEKISRKDQEIAILKENAKSRDKFIIEYTSIVTEVQRELNNLDLVYLGETPIDGQVHRPDLKEEILRKIEKMKLILEENKSLIKKIGLSETEISKLENLADELKDKVEKKDIEIHTLKNKNFDLREKNIDYKNELGAKSLENKEANFEIKKLEESLQELEMRNEELKKENEACYLLLVTSQNVEMRKIEKNKPVHVRCKKPRVISSSHKYLESSYRLEKIKRKEYCLKIFDWQAFWEKSKILVIFHKS